ncbi:MAG: UvrD-helicase domain-containing protein [[Eubacterium] siraeum]|nr:UvrD-helicase domain-containing protein [[Eubacterium] siraeum]
MSDLKDVEMRDALKIDALTDDQKNAVLAKGHVIVSAAAGSGKTHTMVKRILLMVCEGVSLRDMLVLVYNTAAADELKERLHGGLFELACASRGELKERLRKEIDDLPFCHICTIHAFCSALIRENFDKLGLSPTFEVLDEQANSVYMNKALDNVFETYSKDEDAVFDNIAEIFSKARREDNLRTNIIKLHGIIDIQPDKGEFLKKVSACFDDFDNSEFMVRLKEYYKSFFENALNKLVLNSELIETTSLEKYKEAVQIEIALCKQELGANSFWDMCTLAADFEKPNLGTRSRKLGEEEKRISDVTKFYIDEIAKVVKELAEIRLQFDSFRRAHPQNKAYIDKIVEITERFDEELIKLKAEGNVLSFEDLQRYAGRLLDEYPSLGDVYEAVFVDEYQDVNPTQEAIIEHLVRGECFMVGDVKQSIYGFRLADPAIFLSRKAKYENGEGVAISFNKNFRSSRAILSFVNGVFGSVMTKSAAQVDYKSDGAFDLKDAPDDGGVQIHLFTEKKAETKIADGLYDIAGHGQDDKDIKASQFEGKFIAKEIKSLVGHALVEGREMRYGDIAVLFRSRTRGARLIIEQLKAEGIPVEDGSFSKSVSRPEREIICMLRVLDNPRQDIPLAGFLLSYFGGCGEEELAEVASLNGECFYDKVKEYATLDNPLAAKLKKILEAVDGYRVKASFKNVAELMNGIVSDFCYDAYLMKSGEADVYGLKSFIAGVAGQEPKSLGRFLDEYCESGDGAVASGGGDRVHVSTFHGYKGLEIPVAFVSDCACDFNFDTASDMSALGNGYIGLRYFDFENKHKFDTLSKLAVSKLNRLQQVGEEMRLFYVALTRAKQFMYVTASVSKAERDRFGAMQKLGLAGCDLDFISAAICDGEANTFTQIHAPEDFSEDYPKDEHLPLPADGEIVKEIERIRMRVYPYAESTKIAMKYSVSALDNDEQAVRVFEEGASLGTTYHKVMQYVDFATEGEEGVRRELARMKSENLLSEEEASVIDPSVIASCLDSDIMKYARQAEGFGKCMRETPFMMYKPASEIDARFATDDKVLVQGVIDLFINGDEKVLVDFKYSRLDDKRLAEKYKTQLYLYKTAIESAICAKIDKVAIYSFLSKSVVYLDF